MEKETVSLLLNTLIFLPLVGVPFILALGKSQAKYIALIVSLITFLLSVLIYWEYRKHSTIDSAGDFVFKSAYVWLKANLGYIYYDVNFITGVDGVSIYLVLLTTFLFVLSIWYSMNAINDKEKSYYLMLLLLEVGVLGVFLSLDLLIFYIFFEIGLIPMYFLIGMWGSKGTQVVLGREVQSRVYAAVKFFLYTLVGSFVMLIAILFLGYAAGNALKNGNFTTDFIAISKGYSQIQTWLANNGYNPLEVEKWLFLAFALSFLIKVPAFPLHTWLPDAHTQAPTAGSVILAGVLLKMGTYGLVRFCLPLFPAASVYYASTLCWLGMIGIIYGGMAAMVQPDMKKLVAYSSVAHMGFIVIGIFSFNNEAMRGAILQMINHGISTPALFFLVGMMYDRTHTRLIEKYQGIASVVPVFTLMFMISTLASIGLPGLNGFVGEFMILLGSFKSNYVANGIVIISTTGVIVAAVYMLWMFRRVMFGEIRLPENHQIPDLTKSEIGVLLPLVLLMFVIGLHATPFLSEIGKSSDIIVQSVFQSKVSVPGLGWN